MNKRNKKAAVIMIAMGWLLLAGPISATLGQEILEVDPLDGAWGTHVTISGSGLGARMPKVFLVTSGTRVRRLKVTVFSDTEIEAEVGAAPQGTYAVAVKPAGAGGQVVVSAWTFTVHAPEFG